MIIHFCDGSHLTCNTIKFASCEEMIIDDYRRVWTYDVEYIESMEEAKNE